MKPLDFSATVQHVNPRSSHSEPGDDPNSQPEVDVRVRFDLELPVDQARFIRRRAVDEDRTVTAVLRRIIAKEMMLSVP